MAEVEAIFLDHIALERAASPGVPEGVLRQLFDAKYGRCACKAYMQFSDPAAWEAKQQEARMASIREYGAALREAEEAAK